MQLRRVHIRNFRSVENATVEFTPRFRTLVGKNEAGKSNILEALRHLDESHILTKDDLREVRQDETPYTEAFIRFVFTLDQSDTVAIAERLQSLVHGRKLSDVAMLDGSTDLSLAEIVRRIREGLFQAILLSRTKQATHWKLSDSLAMNCELFALVDGAKAHVLIENAQVSAIPGSLYDISVVPEAARTSFRTATFLDLSKMISKAVTERVSGSLPDVVFWQYSDDMVLPGKVDIAEFAADPQSCEPLRQMFTLAGEEDPAEAIDASRARSNGFRNLLNRVAAQSTKHIREVWPEYQGIELSLAENGSSIEATIRDVHNVYDLSRRSDGFKRFVTFLLMISASVRNEEMDGALLLIDDPDLGLHPSGVRYLRDELMKIAETSYVVCASHSVFMIDREHIERHLLVKKADETTTVSEANGDNIVDEEILYNALGASVFEILRARNLVFEGRRDRVLFQTALSRVPKEFAAAKALKEFGTCYVRGIKDVPRVTPLLDLAGRRYLVVSDGDGPAREGQRSFKGDGAWVRYDELGDGTEWQTAEDFIVSAVLVAASMRVAAEDVPAADAAMLAIPEGPGKLSAIDKWLQLVEKDRGKRKAVLSRIKEEVFQSLKTSHISQEYYGVLVQLVNVAEGTSTNHQPPTS
ncbi:MAG: AAA family ATPase [Phycisphaeraceae bacterium]|nr:AAA family ATPase [Phycisphaeraceae bacterium]MCW5763445.1 AAA family ATPase [Phycisphaeraceae bacterium]